MSNLVTQMAPRVSVVMSVYNEARRLEFTIERLRQQTFQEFELIIVNDGSTDASPFILDRYQQLDPRIQVVHQDNSGITRALIRGCCAARGEFVARHDADDWSEPTRLASQVALLEAHPDVGLVSCTTRYMGPNGEELDLIVRNDTPVEATRKLLDEQQGPPAHGSVMFRRSLYESVGGYRAEFYYAQDADLWLRMAEHSLIAYDRRILYFHRRDPLSTSGRMGLTQREYGRWGQRCRTARREGRSEQHVLDEARTRTAELLQADRRRPTRNGQAIMAYMIGTTLSRQQDARASGYFGQTIRLNPFYWKAWLRLFWEFARFDRAKPVANKPNGQGNFK